MVEHQRPGVDQGVVGGAASLRRPDHGDGAVDAALEMRRRLSKVNLDLSRQGFPALRHGIGLHTGTVVAANIGSPQRLSYALVGEAVNVASRIQELNKEFDTDILISEAVYKKVDSKGLMRPLKRMSVKGIRDPLQLFSIDNPIEPTA